MGNERYDVVVIGSGVGGLAAGSLLAQTAGKRVCVLERHFELGGFNHAFTRRGYHWDVGLHYVGQMGPGEQGRRLMDLATGGAVDWVPMPAEFDVFHYPDLEVAQPGDPEAWFQRLGERFPAERAALTAYRRDLRAVTSWMTREYVALNLPEPIRAAAWHLNRSGRRLALMTTREYLAGRFVDPQLRAVLASQWGDYALPPARSAFGTHAMIVTHYLGGAWYPVGGSTALTAAMVRQIEAAGGSCRASHEVRSILRDATGRACGVAAHAKRGRGGSEVKIHAPVVVSDAGLATTLGRLLPPGPGTEPAVARLVAAAQEAGSGTANVVAYLGLRESPERLGLRGENHWFFAGTDHDATYGDGRGAIRGHVPTTYLSLPSLKDPTATAHTAELITSVDPACFEEWADAAWMRRGAEYEALKARIADALLAVVEAHYPGFRGIVDYVEVSTPATVRTFTGLPSGGFAQLAGTPARLRARLTPADLPVPGLYLAGADACSLGIMGALMGGVFAAGAVLGPTGVPRLMAAARKGTVTADAATGGRSRVAAGAGAGAAAS